jgi:hypothetical protein
LVDFPIDPELTNVYSVWRSCGDGQKIFPVGDRERTIPSTGFGFTALVAEDLVLGKLRMSNEGASWWQPSVFRS